MKKEKACNWNSLPLQPLFNTQKRDQSMHVFISVFLFQSVYCFMHGYILLEIVSQCLSTSPLSLSTLPLSFSFSHVWIGFFSWTVVDVDVDVVSLDSFQRRWSRSFAFRGEDETQKRMSLMSEREIFAAFSRTLVFPKKVSLSLFHRFHYLSLSRFSLMHKTHSLAFSLSFAF